MLRTWCGFGAEKTVTLFDGTGEPSVTVTHRLGRKVKQVAGTSRYAQRSTLSFVDGQPDGEERVTRADGTLERVLTWKRGVQHGLDKTFAKDGKRVVVEAAWKDGVLERRTEFFLNGNPKREDVFDGSAMRRSTEYFDLGAVRTKGVWRACERRFGERWCEDGLHQSFFESGAREGEVTFKAGARLASRRWYEHGPLEEEASWLDGKLTKQTTYFPDAGVRADDAFEEDGSRKVRRP